MTSSSADLDAIRDAMRAATLPDENAAVRRLVDIAALDAAARYRVCERGADLIRDVREKGDTGLMEVFLAEYGLSTREGVALMCLAEALLRVPDDETIEALIEDKIAPSEWGRHIGHSSSPLVNASTWALLITGKVLKEGDQGLASALRGAVKRLGEPVIRTAVSHAMRELGSQFVLGRNIEEARDRASRMEEKGYTYSYDMLGEAARTESDARRYHLSYSDAITALAPACRSKDIRENPGISVKLSALHPRYEEGQRERVMSELVARARSLALLAKSAGMGFNIDAEEADRLDLSLDVIAAILADPALKGWDGFGIVVQAYGPRASYVIDWLYTLAGMLNRRIMIRLVKGAYWDTEIKRAQTLGLKGFPVFTRKASTDVSYIACAKKLLGMTGRIYPQFATHNAHTAAAILEMADDYTAFEFQRLHGMGEALHDVIKAKEGTRCRIYAPVGAHEDLLAYLVRRLLENGANSSFVNQIVDTSLAPEMIATDPFAAVERHLGHLANPNIAPPPALYGEGRANARGWDLADPADIAEFEAERSKWHRHQWTAWPLTVADSDEGETIRMVNPADPDDVVGDVRLARREDVTTAIAEAHHAVPDWAGLAPSARGDILRRAADLYETNAGELFAVLAREAGKNPLDAIAELREAVDFLRYYAVEAEAVDPPRQARGVFACISPWNFPLAIFTGQLSAALAAGNAVVAKPAEQTPLVAFRAVQLLHEAGVPAGVLQLLPGDGPGVGAVLSAAPDIDGFCFTGSTATARLIDRAMTEKGNPRAPLIAETGGLNAMIVDSTALPEQAVRDIVASAFQSAGQRCSALRVLYVQRDVAQRLLEMLFGAMDELVIGDPWDRATDVGPVIDSEALAKIEAHVGRAAEEGRLMKQVPVPETGTFAAPSVIRVNGIGDLEEEIFGPVLHVATFEADEIDRVVDAINATGYGLTFGLHTRIDDRVQQIVGRVKAGNLYVNRNQIGAIVGSQPFGGEGLSGTGPKAGGPHYLPRFTRLERPEIEAVQGEETDAATVEALVEIASVSDGRIREVVDLPGPTGESNRLTTISRGAVLCLGPGAVAARAQAREALAAGCTPIAVAPGIGEIDGAHVLDAVLPTDCLGELFDVAAVCCWGDETTLRDVRRAFGKGDGPLPQISTEPGMASIFTLERHLCVDTTAAGGNATLLAAAER
jgi:RHH-type proline utilization regulon transcriptional repressor/proline dehydrogenase/delta 1-pyrroline-5-carboxylate dehydrogenase